MLAAAAPGVWACFGHVCWWLGVGNPPWGMYEVMMSISLFTTWGDGSLEPSLFKTIPFVAPLGCAAWHWFARPSMVAN